MFIAKDNRMFYALLIAICVQSVGVFTLIQLGIIDFTAGNFAWLGVIFGSFVFGIGIVLAGGCATGTWYRAGEGLLGSWIALFAYMLMAAVMKTGVLAPVNTEISSITLPENSIAATFGVSNWIFIVALLLITGGLVYRELRKPKIAIPSLKPKRTGLNHLLFEKDGIHLSLPSL